MSKRRPAPRRGRPAGKEAPLPHRVALDRFEDGRDGAKLAVLVTDDGRSIVVPRDLLPAGASAGATLRLDLTLDPEATADVARETRAIRDDLKKTDPGGTIQL